jgi:PDZ domain-containing protein
VNADVPAAAVGEGPPTRRGRGRRWLAVLLIVLVVVAGGAVYTDHQAGHFYAYQPGSAPLITASSSCRLDAALGELTLPGGEPCARLVVPAGRAHDLTGRLLMVDVLVGPATPMEYLLDKLGLLNVFHRGSQLIPAAAVLGSTPASQLACQDTEEMAQATSTAPIVALQRLGYDVHADNQGAQVDLVVPGSAAARAGLQCNDLVTSIDGRRISTAESLAAAIRTQRPGAKVRITLERTGSDGKQTDHTYVADLGSVPAEDGQAAEPHVGFLGVATETRTTYRLPFDVGIDVGDIGGPSAGLALTLGILDVLSDGRLTGGHTVAATGTISPDGAVGDVGGVAQKTVAVQRSGATLFLVPPEELATAKQAAQPGLEVEAVTSLDQALADLRAVGGTVPQPSSKVSSPT